MSAREVGLKRGDTRIYVNYSWVNEMTMIFKSWENMEDLNDLIRFKNGR